MIKRRLLIVDDEDKVKSLLTKVFLREGYEIYTAADGYDALDIIDNARVDIVITDIKMPSMTGIELLQKIKNVDNSIVVILMTAFATIETAIEALRIGASDYITKPFDLDEMVMIVNKHTQSLEREEASIDHEKEKMLQNNLVVSKSPSMQKIIQLIQQVANSQSTIMIQGETGTGKEIIAHAIHNLSNRSDKAFIKINCAAIPETLLESELFGYEKGAFTGAVTRKPGRFELAEQGTIFLDEIGEIPQTIQVKLLRVLQEREYELLGGVRTMKADVRIITATNKDLEKLVKENRFREDLYYRINVVPIHLPPLRERKQDIDFLVEHFLKKSAMISNRPIKRISAGVKRLFNEYDWPGNIRELENIIERCVVVTHTDVIEVEDLPEKLYNNKNEWQTESSGILDMAIDQTEKEAIQRALRICNGNKTRASEYLGISRRSLHRKILKYELED